jgi:hypothetical protein
MPTCSYTTSILIAPSMMQLVVRGGEKEMSNNLDTHSDQTQHVTQVHPADSNAETKKM